jgi:hypothetical protein
MHDPYVCELQDENQKLKAENERLQTERDEALGKAADAEAKYAKKGGYLLQRLRQMRREHEKAAEQYGEALEAQDAEIERLRTLLKASENAEADEADKCDEAREAARWYYGCDTPTSHTNRMAVQKFGKWLEEEE